MKRTSSEARLLIAFSLAMWTNASVAYCQLKLDVRFLQDSTLTHEQIPIEIEVLNEGSERLIVNDLLFMRPVFDVQVFDAESGQEIPVGMIEALRLRADSANAEYLDPGESATNYSDFTMTSGRVEPGTYHYWWPAGYYMAVFKWTYDPWGRATLGPSPILQDSAFFRVIEGSAYDHRALDRLISALAMSPAKGGDARAEAFWLVVRDFPESPYAGVAASVLRRILTTAHKPPGEETARPQAMLPFGMDNIHLALVMGRWRAHDYGTFLDVKSIISAYPEATREHVLDSIARMVPGTRVGQAAKAALRDVQK